MLLHARVGGDGKSLLHRSGRFNQHMQGQARTIGAVQRPGHPIDLIDGFCLGQHDVGELVAHLADDAGHIIDKGGMVQRMHAHGDTGIGVCGSMFAHQGRDRIGMATSCPTVAPSSQSRVTSNTQRPSSAVICACNCRLLRMRSGWPLK